MRLVVLRCLRYMVMDSYNPVFAVAYFLFLVLVTNSFLLNVALAVVDESLNEFDKEEERHQALRFVRPPPRPTDRRSVWPTCLTGGLASARMARSTRAARLLPLRGREFLSYTQQGGIR